MKKKNESIILGIDPGTIVMGYAVIAVDGNKVELRVMDVLKLSSKKDAYERLEMIHRTVSEVIAQYHPDSFAIEAPFFGKNVQSMLKLGRAQGVAIAAAMQASLSVCEYSPKKVKQSVTGNGNADKEQVWKMVQRIMAIEEQPKYFDATDALAVALCHHYQCKSPVAASSTKTTKSKAAKGWGDFIAKNPEKIIQK